MSIDPTSLAPTTPGRINAVRAAHGVLLAFAIGATLVADVALAAVPGRGPHVVPFVFFGLTLGQVATAAAWTVMGRRWWLARLVVALTWTCILAYPLSWKIDPPVTECLGFLLLFAAGVAAPVVGLRLAGWQISRQDDAVNCEATPQPWRYSLGALFALTTATAILTAIMRAASFPGQFLLIALAYCAVFAAVAFLALVAFAAARRWWWVWPLVLAVNSGAGALVGSFESISFGAACITLVETLFLALPAYLLRLSGYHVARRTAPERPMVERGVVDQPPGPW